jgi:hypothetical protein
MIPKKFVSLMAKVQGQVVERVKQYLDKLNGKK